jgi:hypothetical protein
MQITGEWKFDKSGEKEGFNASGIAIFSGNSVESVTRETIQNSLDARLDHTLPVRVRFDIHTLQINESPEFLSLKQWIELASKAQHNSPSNQEAENFYKQALVAINRYSIQVLAIHDSNTKGLTGPLLPSQDEPDGGWVSLVRSSGETNHESENSLGSFGIGGKAPFALSELRTVFYLSRTSYKGENQLRFQGKSILQSMWLSESEFTGKTGFYGLAGADGRSKPLVDDEVPDWARDLRASFATSSGSTLLVAAPSGGYMTEEFWDSLKVAVYANFYYAIEAFNLVVELGNGEVLDSDSIRALFKQDILSKPMSKEGLSEEVLAALESSTTIHMDSGPGKNQKTFESKTFGKVSWYLRKGDGVTGRNVGIARQNGMLITRSAEKLKTFQFATPFDMFVCVEDPRGSEILKRFENPEHNKFDFARVKDLEERKELQKAYEVFASEIRELVRNEASTDTQEEIVSSDLNHIFGAGFDGDESENTDESSTKLIFAQPKKRPVVHGEKTKIDSDDVQPGRGNRTGNGVAEGTGGNLPDESGQGEAPKPNYSGVQVKDLRISAKDKQGFVEVRFTPTRSGSAVLRLYKSGATDKEILEVQLSPSGPWTSEIPVKGMKDSVRKMQRMRLRDEDYQFSLEGVIS